MKQTRVNFFTDEPNLYPLTSTIDEILQPIFNNIVTFHLLPYRHNRLHIYHFAAASTTTRATWN